MNSDSCSTESSIDSENSSRTNNHESDEDDMLSKNQKISTMVQRQ